MANEKVNKVVLGSEVLIDLTQDTAVANKVLYGYTFHTADGETATGSCTYDADTSDATASDAEVLATKTFYKNGTKHTGSMTNRGSVTLEIDDLVGEAIPSGYHDGGGTASIKSSEADKIIASNIKDGVTILGVLGTYTGEGVTAQTKTATPSLSSQTILPDSGYDYLAEVDINPIPVSRVLDPTTNGYTVTIAGS